MNEQVERNTKIFNRKIMKRALAVVLSILMLVTAIDYSGFQNITVALAATYTYDISEGAITITAGTNSNTLKVAYGAGLSTDNIPINQAITVTGTTNGTRNRVYIVGVTVTIVLSDVSITTEHDWTWASPIELSSGANVTLKLSGSNTLFSSDCGAGISVPAGCSLTITSNNGDGSTDGILNATAHGDALNASAGYYYDGAGIGAEGGTGVTTEATKTVGSIMIKGGTIFATGGYGGAGIGGSILGTTGSITISGGKVIATPLINNSNGVAGIGGGFGGNVPEINITGGEVQSYGRNGGAGIGGGYGSNSCGKISISGGKIDAVGGGYGAASIGYGSNSAKTGGSVIFTGGDINLSGGTINPEATNGMETLKQYNLNLIINDERLTTSLQNASVTINDTTYTAYINVTNSVGTASVTAFIPVTYTGEKSLTINAAPYCWTTTANISGTGGDVFVTISPKTVSSPTIELSANNFSYDGTAKEPTVTVKDGNTVIDSSEYTVGYSDNTNVGTATVTVSDVAGGNYTVNGTQIFAITGATPTVTVSASPLSSASYGSSVTLIANVSGVNSEMPTGTVTFKDGTNTIASDIALTDGTASYSWTTTAIGDHSIIVEYTPSTDGIGKNYISAISSFLSYTITKRNQSELNIDNIGTKNYGDDNFTLSTTGGNGTGDVIYTSSDPTIVSISGTTATIHNLGTVTITATKAEDSTYIETTATVSLTIGKAMPTVTLDADTTGKVFGDTVSVTASVMGVNSELPTGTLTLKEGTTSIATASLNNGVGILTWTNPPIGDHTITVEYTAASDGIGINYTNAESNTITFNIAKADITGVTVTGNTGVYQGFIKPLPGYTISGTIPEGVKVYYQWKLEDGSWSNGGTYWNPAWESGIVLNHTGSITVRVKLSGDNYNDYISDEVTSTLFPKNISDENIVIDELGVIADKYYTGNAIQQDAVAIRYDCTQGNYEILNPETDYDISYEKNTSVGEASLIINGKENYTGTVTKKFNIKYYDGIVTPAYNGNTTKDDWYAGDVTLTAAGFTISDSLSGTYASNYTLTGEGTVSKTLYFKQDGTGYITEGKTVTVNIDKTLPVFSGETDGITTSDNHWKSLLNKITFGHIFKETKSISISATDSGSGVAKYYYYIDTTGSTTAKTAGELNPLTFTEAGSGSFSISDDNKYVIYAYVVDFVGNKSAYICTDGIVIDKTAPTVTLTAPAVSNLVDVSATAKVRMSETGTIAYVIETSEQSGITAGDILDAAEKKTVSITDGQIDTDLDVALSSLTANTTYYIYAVGTDSAENNSSVANVSFTTSKTQPIFVSNPTITGIYGQQVKDMTVSQVTSTNRVAGSWSVADSATAVPSVGTSAAYDVIFTPDDAAQYATVTVQVTPTVGPKSLAADSVIIGAVSGTHTYDGTAKEPTVTVTDSTAAMTASDYEYSYSNNTNAGTATVTVTGKGNYTGTVNRTFTIAKAPVPSITFPTASGITYGQKLSASTLTGGSTQYGTFAWTDGNTVPTVANSGYEVTFTPNANTRANYVAITNTTDTVAITVSKATPAVTVNAVISDDAGSRKAALNVVVTGAGDGEAPAGTVKFVNSTSGSDSDIEGATDVTITDGKAIYTWKGLANQIYTVKAVYSGSGNYHTATSTELIFDTNKKNQAVLTIGNNGTKTYGDSAFTLSATGGSGSGDVTFTSSDPTIVSISGFTATIHKAGNVTITATKAATDTYNEATASVALTVDKKTLRVKADNKLNIVKSAVMSDLTYTVTGLVGNDTFTSPNISTTAMGTGTIGEYNITISGGILANPDSYTVNYTGGKLTIVNESAPQGGSSTGGSSTGIDTALPDAGTPVIKDASNIAGWEAIKEQIGQTKEGDVVTIEMNGAMVVPKEVLGTIRGTDTTLVIDIGDGITWGVNGQSITDNRLEDINFGVTMDTDAIPENLINLVAKEQAYRSISLSHDGKFGFTAVLSINMEKKNAGLYANLFYYNPSSKKLELQSVGKMNENGYVEFMFTHASDYVVALSTEPMFAKVLDQITISATKGNLFVGGTQNKSMTMKLEIPELLKDAIENDHSKLVITYQSSNPNVATVTSTGKIIAKKLGKTTITTLVTINGVQKSFKTEIKVSKAYLKLIKSTKIMKKGKTFTFQVKGYGVNAKDITFYTSKKSIIEINNTTGKAVAKTNGADYVIAKVGNVEVKIKVKVV